jgi:hypothetical protein
MYPVQYATYLIGLYQLIHSKLWATVSFHLETFMKNIIQKWIKIRRKNPISIARGDA